MNVSRDNVKPPNEEIKILFDAVAPRYDAITHSYALKRRVEFFVSHARGDCLEVGAGTGEISKALKQAGHHVIATDIAPQMVTQIRNKIGIEAVVCDAELLPFPDQSFDTVISAEMIYYLDHPERFLAEAHRVLKLGGRLLLSSANAGIARFYDTLRAFLRVLGIGKGTYFDDPVREFMTLDKLRTLLTETGFEVVEEKKIIIVPIGFFDWFNRVFEKTPFSRFGVFILVSAKKAARED